MSKKLIHFVSFVLVLSMALTSTANAELLGWWSFDEGSGDTAYDSSGHDHHGTVLGTPQWEDGPPGFSGALDFSETIGANCGDFDPTGGDRWVYYHNVLYLGWNLGYSTFIHQVEFMGRRYNDVPGRGQGRRQ